ncbi:ribonuclease PH [PVC group bacterium]|nr:ribonuclease PH [PVC group bacterium]
MRVDKRKVHQIRPVIIQRDFTENADGSVLISCGNTKVICTAMVEEKTPNFLKDKNQGWITAEYSMLPGATKPRSSREASKGRQGGRTMEIQRLIGRSLRSVVDLECLGPRTIWIDCDVIQADGGTRCASITGAMVSLCDAIQRLLDQKMIKKNPISSLMGAISVGLVEGEVLLDLCYEEDCRASVDMNVVMAEDGRFVELQATGEEAPFAESEYKKMLRTAKKGIRELLKIQRKVLRGKSKKSKR